MSATDLGIVIQLFLADGNPSGLITAKRLGWTGIGIACSKSRFLASSGRPEFDRSGIYILVGQDDKSGAEMIYIGEADVVRERLKDHVKKKDFWERLVAFTSEDSHLNKAHARYLEARLINIASSTKRSMLDNNKYPATPPLSEAERAYTESFLDEILTILPVLRITSFESPEAILNQSAPELTDITLAFSTVNASATGAMSTSGFIVRAGSTARTEEQPSSPAWISNLRQALINNHVLQASGDDVYEFVQDFEFNSPSAAAAAVAGRSVNGRDDWKDEAGNSLKELQEKAASG